MDKQTESALPEDDTVGAAIIGTVGNDFPSHDEIAILAYSYWEARGHQGGSPEEDWLRAEQELRNQRSEEKD